MSTEDTDTSKIPQTLVGISFDDRFRAQEFLSATNGLAAKGALTLRDAVLVVKNDDGHTMVHETTDLQPGRTALMEDVMHDATGS
jgi:uncharacterized membrane protein